MSFSATEREDYERPNARRSLYLGKYSRRPHFEVWWKDNDSAMYSDWNLVVVDEERDIQTSYAVHKPILKHKSEFFQIAFSGRFGNGNRTSTLKGFPPLVIENFECFLDCIYMKEFLQCNAVVQTVLTAEEIYTLLFCFDYFQMPEQQEKLAVGILRMLRNCQAKKLFHFLHQHNVPTLWDFVIEWFKESVLKYGGQRNQREYFTIVEEVGLVNLYRELKKRDIVEPNVAVVLAKIMGLVRVDTPTLVELFPLIQTLDVKGAMRMLCTQLPRDDNQEILDFQHRCVETIYQSLLTDVPLHCSGSVLGWHYRADAAFALVAKRAMEDFAKFANHLKWLSLRVGQSHAFCARNEQKFLCILKEIKIHRVASMPLYAYFGHRRHCQFKGIYVRKDGQEFYSKNEAHEVSPTAIIQPSKQGSGWEIFSKGGTLLYTNPDEGKYQGLPPFEGWILATDDAPYHWQTVVLSL